MYTNRNSALECLVGPFPDKNNIAYCIVGLGDPKLDENNIP